MSERQLRVMVNQREQKVSVVLLGENGSPLGDVVFERAAAENHAKAVIEAIRLLDSSRQTGLVLPGDPNFPVDRPN